MAKATWSKEESAKFLNILMDEVASGRTTSGSNLSPLGKENLKKRFSKATGKSYEYNVLKNKIDVLKRDYKQFNELANKTDTTPNFDLGIIQESDDWWEERILENKQYRRFRYKPLTEYRKLQKLFSPANSDCTPLPKPFGASEVKAEEGSISSHVGDGDHPLISRTETPHHLTDGLAGGSATRAHMIDSLGGGNESRSKRTADHLGTLEITSFDATCLITTGEGSAPSDDHGKAKRNKHTEQMDERVGGMHAEQMDERVGGRQTGQVGVDKAPLFRSAPQNRLQEALGALRELEIDRKSRLYFWATAYLQDPVARDTFLYLPPDEKVGHLEFLFETWSQGRFDLRK